MLLKVLRRYPVACVLGCVTLATHAPDALGKKRSAAGVASSSEPRIKFDTSKGKIVVRLFADKAPISCKNMLDYVKSGFYEGTIFHRVISDFMVQGGGFTADLKQKSTRAPIKFEGDNGLSNKRGTVAMARTAIIDSATSQFFINVKDNKQLDNAPASNGYAVIGEVVEGMEVVDAIRNVQTRCPSKSGDPICNENLPPGMRDVPRDTIVIKKATVLGGAREKKG